MGFLLGRNSTIAIRGRFKALLEGWNLPWDQIRNEEDLVHHAAPVLERSTILTCCEHIPGGHVGQSRITDSGYEIIYLSDLVGTQKRLTICHELAHLLLGHLETLRALHSPDWTPLPRMRVLSPAIVASLLNRSVYDDPFEREAEILGTLLAAQLDRLDRQRRRTGGGHPGMSTALEHTTPWNPHV